MSKIFSCVFVLLLMFSCSKDKLSEGMVEDNPEISLHLPTDFPKINPAFYKNKPTKFGVTLGEKLFNEKRLSGNNTISCASCHNPAYAFADNNAKSIGVYNRIGLRNAPALQNLAFMQFYNWDGNKLSVESQVLVPIITHEEMNSSISQVIEKLSGDQQYKELFKKAFGEERITSERIFLSLAQYQYTLISNQSKFDKVMLNQETLFTASEKRGYELFQIKCASCHNTKLFTDQSFRNVGFPINPDTEEAGRARVTGKVEDLWKFRVPSLRNAEYTAPYGSFGQFATLKQVLDYFDSGVLYADNLDPLLKMNGNRIPMSEQEKLDIIEFIKTLSDYSFLKK